MWKYKNLMFMAIGTIAIMVMIDLISAFNIYPDAVTLKFLETANILGQLFCTYILIIVLRRHKESTWHIIPFYLLILGKIMTYYVTPAIIKHIAANSQTGGFAGSYSTILAITGFYFMGMYIYLIICCFKVKSDRIASYFQLYAFVTIASVIIAAVVQIMRIQHYGGYGTYIRDLIASLPVFATIWMLYNLYDREENYKPGDIVSTIRELENVPMGTAGTIIKNHGSDFYEVEFIDDKGDLLNVLSVSSDQFERVPMPDLAMRIDSFGQ